jgi:hypothetical protein
MQARRHHQGQRAVEAGQHGLAGGHFDGVDIVGGERHQVAGALALVEAGALQRQARVQAGAQRDAELVGRAVQDLAPGDAQEIDAGADQQQRADFHQQRVAGQGVGCQAVDHGTDLARHPDAEGGHTGQHGAGQDIGAAVLAHKTADQP